MAFTHKQLACTFDLGEGQFGESGTNRVKLAGQLRASASINEAGGPAMSTMDLTVSGMSLSNMNQLSTLGQRVTTLRKNIVTLEAGDAGSGGLSVVYSGQILNAWADFSGMPNVIFRVSAFGGALENMKPVPPTTYRGLVDVVTVLRGLATQAAWTLENNGVSFQLIDPYYPGTIREQIRRCADAAGIKWTVDNNVLAIWPANGARAGDAVLISPSTGLIGYPAFTDIGISLTVSYTPSINYGQRIQVQSDLTPANGLYRIYTLTHTLESETPGGQWNSRIVAVAPGDFSSGVVSTGISK